jgi:putative aldouronate transport system permease protein
MNKQNTIIALQVSKDELKKVNSDKIFDIINFIIITLFFITILYPCIFILSASFSNPDDVISGKMWLFPTAVNLIAYKAVFNDFMIWVGYRNSLIYMVVGTILATITTLFCAYPLSRSELVGRNFFTFLIAFTMFFSGGMIPMFLLIKGLGLYNSPLSIILPSLMSPWNMVVTRTYFQTSIPGELLNSAKIDGCSDSKYFWKIVLPLSTPIIAVISLFYAVGFWNSYFNAMLFLNDKKYYTLQLVLRDILIKNQINEEILDVRSMIERQRIRDLLKYAVIIVASLPVMIIYPFVQK